MILCKNADTDVVEYALSRSLYQTMIAEYKTKRIDKSIPQRKLIELYDVAEEEVKKFSTGLRVLEKIWRYKNQSKAMN